MKAMRGRGEGETRARRGRDEGMLRVENYRDNTARQQYWHGAGVYSLYWMMCNYIV